MDFLSLARSDATEVLDVPLEAVVVGAEEELVPVLPLLPDVLVEPDEPVEAVVVGAEEDFVPVLPLLPDVLVEPDVLLEATSESVEDGVVGDLDEETAFLRAATSVL